jgi:hypothetical protein
LFHHCSIVYRSISLRNGSYSQSRR